MSHKSRLRKQEREPGVEAKPQTKDTSPQVFQRDKIGWTINIRERQDLTARQKEIIDLIMDKTTKVVFINGPAGTSKTWLAVHCGLHIVNQRRASHMTFIRTVVESASRSLGYLPGEFGNKMEPYLMPLMDKLEEMIPSDQIKKLMAEKRIVAMPVNYLRGASMNAQYLIAEESQNYTLKELVTVLTRLGQYSKLIVIGDVGQSDINGSSGFMPLFSLFNTETARAEGVHCVTLTKNDIVRSGIVRYIVDQIEQYQQRKR